MRNIISTFRGAPKGTDKIITHKVLGDMYGMGCFAWIDSDWIDVSHMKSMIKVKLMIGDDNGK